MDFTFYVLLGVLALAGALYWFLFMRSKSTEEKEELDNDTENVEQPEENNENSEEEQSEANEETKKEEEAERAAL